MQRVGERGGVTWYNDSKGTNVGATLAAVQGLEGSFVLIAGGLGKDQDFSPLRAALTGRARAVVLIGRDAPLIEQALRDAVPTEHASDLGAAVRRAAEIASPGDSVVLSPACASFDMFSGYEERGERFVEAVKGLGA
jgi:UDP-N-acetylmuramoylalanine--D-glutamate ligase